MKKWLLMGVVAVALAAGACADMIWSEDFADVDSWSKISDTEGSASLTAAGGLGLYNVPVQFNEAAFVTSDRIAFNPLAPESYTLYWTVASITDYASYDIALDLFDSENGYVDTIWSVVPRTDFMGAGSINLGGLDFASGNRPNTAYVSPKVDAFSSKWDGEQWIGGNDQTIGFDSMEMAIPEPASMALLGAGLALAFGWKRSKNRRMS